MWSAMRKGGTPAPDPFAQAARAAIDLVWEVDARGRLAVLAAAAPADWPDLPAPGGQPWRLLRLDSDARQAIRDAIAARRAFAGLPAMLVAAGQSRPLLLGGRPRLDACGGLLGYHGWAMAAARPPVPPAPASDKIGIELVDAVLGRLARALDAEYALVTTPCADGTVTVAFVFANNGRRDNVWEGSFEIATTPSGDVLRSGRPLVVSGNLQDHYPRQARFRNLGMDAYAGAPIRQAGGHPLGTVAVLKARPFADPQAVETALAEAGHQLSGQLERALAERKLRDQAARLAVVVDNLPGMAYRVKSWPDGRRRFLYAGGACTQVLGRTAADLLGLTPEQVAALRHPDDADPSPRTTAERLAGGGQLSARLRVVHPDGAVRWLHKRERLAVRDGRALIVDGLLLDVTDEVEARLALESRGTELRAIADYTINWESWLKPGGRLRWVNPGVEAVTGYRVAECMEMADYPRSMLDPADLAAYDAAIAAAWNGESVGEIDMRFRRKWGTPFWGSLSIRPITDGDGVTIGLRTAVHDIERRKLAEQSLRQRERDMARVLAALNLAREGVLVTDPAGNVAYANAAAAALLGTAPAEALVGRDWRDLGLAASPAAPFLDAIAASVTSRGGWKGEILLSGADGPTHVDSRFARLTDGGFIAVLTDIGERKRSEQRMRDSEERYRALFDGAGDAILLMEGARIVDCNPRAIELFGRSRAEMLDHQPHAFSPARQPDGRDSLAAGAEKLSATLAGTPQNYEWVQERPDGRLVPVEISLTSMSRRGRPYIFALVRDITERRRREDERRRLEEQLQQTRKLEALGQLAGGIAHDFNNLLGAIFGFAAFIVEDIGEQYPSHHHARRIVTACERARGLVRQILAFSRRAETERCVFDLAGVVEEAQGLLSGSLPSTTRLLVEPAVAASPVEADRDQLSQVVINLAINAHDSLGGRPGTVSVAVRPTDHDDPDLARLAGHDRPEISAAVECRVESGEIVAMTGQLAADGDHVSIHVDDNGPGIPAEVLDHIFDPFFTTKEKGRGTGLGLAVVHAIVLAHGGAIVVRSRPGIGTSFEVVLPLSRAALPAPRQPAPAPIAAAGGRLLLVDDDLDFGDMLMTALERRGFEVAACTTAAEALDILREAPDAWDVLLTDQTMPDMRGSDLVAAVKAINPGLPCLICTGFSDAVSEVALKECGAFALVHKPVDFDLLTRLLATRIAG